MKYYELNYLASSDFSKEELKTFSQKISGFILEEEGKIENAIEPVRRKLGYAIKKKEEAFLITLIFYLNPEKLADLEKKLKAEAQIIRYMILSKKKPVPEAPPRAKKPEIKEKPLIIEKKEEVIQPSKPKKVELKEIDQKIEEILK